jgi:glutathione peroxidase
MFSKVSVKGDDQHPLFNFLTSVENPDFTGEINWNFEKFLIDKEGTVQHQLVNNLPLGRNVDEALRIIDVCCAWYSLI